MRGRARTVVHVSAPDLNEADVTRELSPAAATAVARIAASWGLTGGQVFCLVGDIDKRPLEPEQLTRVSYLLGIYAALQTLYSGELRVKWMTIPNSNELWEGSTPLDFALAHGTKGLARIRGLLEGYTA